MKQSIGQPVKYLRRSENNAAAAVGRIFLGFVILSITLLFIANFSSDNLLGPLEIFTFVVNGTFFGAMFANTLVRRPISLATIAWFFALLFFFLVPFVQGVTGSWKWFSGRELQNTNLLVATNSFVFFAYAVFAIAYHKMLLKPVAKERDAYIHQYMWIPSRVVILFVIYMGILGFYVSSFGGIESIFWRQARFEGVDFEVGETSGQRSLLSIGNNIARPGLLFLTFIVFFCHAYLGKKKMAKWKDFGSLAAFLLLAAVTANFPTGPARSYVLSVGFMLIAIIVRTEFGRFFWIFLYTTIGIYLSSILDQFRREIRNFWDIFEFNKEYFFAGHFNGYETVMHCFLWVKSQGVSYGYEMVGTLLFWIPRTLWQGKPTSPSVEASLEYFGPKYGVDAHNIGLSTLGSFYHSFGIFGAPVFGLAIGLFAGYLDSHYADCHKFYRSRREQFRYALPSLTVYPFLAGAFIILLRGSIWTGFQSCVAIILSFMMIRLFAIRKIALTN